MYSLKIPICFLFFFFPILLLGQLISGTIQHNGLTRNYNIYLPANIAPNASLVFSLHGRTANATANMNRTNMNAMADNFGFAVCYPQGELSDAGVTYWNSGMTLGNHDDVGFITTLAAYVQQTYQLNPAETFCTGFSNGGYMSYHLACNASGVFRAIAPVGGLMSGGTFNACSPSATPIFHIHGSADNLVPAAGYPDLNDGWGEGISVVNGINYWNGVNNCGVAVRDTLNMPSGTQVIRDKYETCNDPIWNYLVMGEGHSYPNSTGSQTDFPATQEIWKFFSQFTSQPYVETNFEGGNGELLAFGANNYIKIESEFKGNDTRNITYFCKILGLDATQPLQLEAITEYTGDYTFYSYNNVDWFRSNPKVGNIFTVPLVSSEIYVAHFYPYLYSRISSYLDSLQSVQKDYYEISGLAINEARNPVEIVKITVPCVDDTDKKLIWINGRMHGFEHPANYATEGMLRFFVSNEDQAKRLRKEAIIYIVPMMDVESAINGKTGKDQNPVDFNRDWVSPTHNSHWNATVAAKTLLNTITAQNELSIFVDMHSISPTGLESFHFIYNNPDQIVRGQNFIDRTNANNGFLYTSSLFSPLNTATSQDYALQYLNTPSLLSITPETSFNFTATGVPWTVENLIDQGKAFGRASSDYINGTDFPNQIVIDNTDAANITTTGTWINYASPDGFYDTDYVFVSANTNATYTFNFTGIQSGLYEAAMFYPNDDVNATNVNCQLQHPNGSRNYVLDQTILGGQWRLVDTLTLANNGSNVSFTIDANNTDGFVEADAFRLKRIDDPNVSNSGCNTVDVNLKVYLEGAMDFTGLTEMHTFLNNNALIPLSQPYNILPYNYSNNVSVSSLPTDAVDWVLIEARTGSPALLGNPTTALVETQVGILNKDGFIVDPNGNGGVKFSNLIEGNDYRFLVRHRNHLDVISAQSLVVSNLEINYDFTINATQAYGSGQLKASPTGSHYMMYAGDYDHDGIIQTSDFDRWKIRPSVLMSYEMTDGNLDGTTQTTDFDKWYVNQAKLGIGEVRY